MSGIDIRCPVCGTINFGLDLIETDGWMECEHCGCTARLISLHRRDATVVRNCCWQIIKPLPGGGALRAVRNHG